MSSGHLDRRDPGASFRAPGDAPATTGTSSSTTGTLSSLAMREVVIPRAAGFEHSAGRRRTPRKSLILVLPDNHSLALDELAQRLPVASGADVDLIVACAGQHSDLNALRRAVGVAQFLLAPSGTSTADLRELAMKQAPGDIVTLLNGAVLLATPAAEPELSQSA